MDNRIFMKFFDAMLVCMLFFMVGSAHAYQWEPTKTVGGDAVSVLVIDPITPSILYAATRFNGIFKSVDSGNSWIAINAGLIDLVGIGSIAIDPLSPSTLYAGTWSGVFKSSDSGNSWVAANLGLGGGFLGADSIAIDPLNPSTLYVGTWSGLFKSVNSAASWVLVSSGVGAGCQSIASIAVDPVTSSTLYMGANECGLLKSLDAGATWTLIQKWWNAFPGGNWSDVTEQIVIDPVNPSTLYSLVWDYVGTGGPTALKSLDSGATWTSVSFGTVGGKWFLAIDPVTPSMVYAVMGQGIRASLDGGINGTVVNIGLENMGVNTIAIDPVNPSIIYVGHGLGVQKGATSVIVPADLVVPSDSGMVGCFFWW